MAAGEDDEDEADEEDEEDVTPVTLEPKLRIAMMTTAMRRTRRLK